LSQPVGHPVLAVAANVRVDDDDGEERRQRYEDHVDTEVHTWRIAAHTEASFHHNNKRAMFRTDGKRPDGLALVPWQSGRSLCWDVTVICPLAESYVTGSAREAGAAAELAASRKGEKYANIGSLRSSRG